jgi:hypothetical protein
VIAKIPSGWAEFRDSPMQQSLLDECHESILKIAETQPPDGKRAILAMAEVFHVNYGRMSSDGQPSSPQDFHASDRRPMASSRP